MGEKISLKWKIFLFLLAFIFILLLILWTFQIVYLDSVYKWIKTREAKTATSKIESVLNDEASGADTQIDEIAAEYNLAVFVADNQGNALYNAEYIPTSRLNTIPFLEFSRYYQAAKENNGSATIEFKGEKNQTFLEGNPELDPPFSTEENIEKDPYNPNPLKNDGFVQNHGQQMAESVIFVRIIDTVEEGKEEQILLVNSVLTPVTATVNTLKAELFVISIVMVFLSLILALIISRHVSKSLIRLNQSAKVLAVGDFQVEFDGRDYKEIAELSDSLNHAALELGKTEKFRRELLANISHDLRTPLTMIIAYAEVMRDLPGENTPENIQVVIDESKRLTNLVNDMFDISKLQAGVLKLNQEPFNLTKSIEAVLERYNKLKEQDGLNIVFQWEQQVCVNADEYKIFQVIYNLINNAINYTGADQTVVVKQIKNSETVRIEVCDSGEGIPKEMLPYVWDRYYKVNQTHKRAVMGTGLGLSIVKSILDLHHSKFGVISELEKGSTFWFELDALKE